MDFKSLARGRDKTQLAGFSLIEVVIYIALFGAMVATMTSVITIIMQTDSKITAAAEVQEISMFALNRVEQAAEGAQAITTPVSGAGSMLELRMRDNTLDPTRVEVVSGVLQIVEGSGLVRNNLTSSRIRVTAFTVSRIPSVTGDALRINYTFTSNILGLSHQNELNYVQTLSLRK